ncbi:hypothetical protein K438DRAFT_1759997 [Mycena galopus ATCC 62051]|nr:hypothetical protein K438DRAFT_1759997 [Mycena galopus ATCC 62051]
MEYGAPIPSFFADTESSGPDLMQDLPFFGDADMRDLDPMHSSSWNSHNNAMQPQGPPHHTISNHLSGWSHPNSGQYLVRASLKTFSDVFLTFCQIAFASHVDLIQTNNSAYLQALRAQAQLTEKLKTLHSYRGSYDILSESVQQSATSKASQAASSSPTLDVDAASLELAARAEFPSIQFWTREDFNTITKSKKITTINEDAPKRGNTRAANDVNVMHLYVERHDGKPVSGREATDMRKTQTSIWQEIARSSPEHLPAKWGEASLTVRNFHRSQMYKHYPFLRCCEKHWKVDLMATTSYSSWHKKSIKKKCTCVCRCSSADPEDTTDEEDNSAAATSAPTRKRKQPASSFIASTQPKRSKQASSSPSLSSSLTDPIFEPNPPTPLLSPVARSPPSPSPSIVPFPAAADQNADSSPSPSSSFSLTDPVFEPTPSTPPNPVARSLPAADQNHDSSNLAQNDDLETTPPLILPNISPTTEPSGSSNSTDKSLAAPGGIPAEEPAVHSLIPNTDRKPSGCRVRGRIGSGYTAGATASGSKSNKKRFNKNSNSPANLFYEEYLKTKPAITADEFDAIFSKLPAPELENQLRAQHGEKNSQSQGGDRGNLKPDKYMSGTLSYLYLRCSSHSLARLDTFDNLKQKWLEFLEEHQRLIITLHLPADTSKRTKRTRARRRAKFPQDLELEFNYLGFLCTSATPFTCISSHNGDNDTNTTVRLLRNLGQGQFFSAFNNFHEECCQRLNVDRIASHLPPNCAPGARVGSVGGANGRGKKRWKTKETNNEDQKKEKEGGSEAPATACSPPQRDKVSSMNRGQIELSTPGYSD